MVLPFGTTYNQVRQVLLILKNDTSQIYATITIWFIAYISGSVTEALANASNSRAFSEVGANTCIAVRRVSAPDVRDHLKMTWLCDVKNTEANHSQDKSSSYTMPGTFLHNEYRTRRNVLPFADLVETLAIQYEKYPSFILIFKLL